MGSQSASRVDLVRPSMPLVPGYRPLPPMDQYMMRIILPIICIFEFNEPLLQSTVLNNLKEGLSRTIDDIPFIASDIVPGLDEQGSIRLRYSNDAGVWFHLHQDESISYDWLKEKEFALSVLPWQQLMPPPGYSSASPVLTAQVTTIAGGFVLAFNAHHAVMDAQGVGTLAALWAKHVHAVSEGRLVPDKDRFSAASLDQSDLYAPTMHQPLSDFPPYSFSDARPSDETHVKLLDAAMKGDGSQRSKFLRFTSWHLTDEMRQALREEIQPRLDGEYFLPENSAITALIWMHITKARRLTNQQVANSSLFTAVDSRRRMKPPIPADYPGNCIVLSRATANSSELESLDSRCLYSIAQKVAKSIDWWTADEIWSLIGAIQSHPRLENAIAPPAGNNVMVTSPSRLASVLFESNWGKGLGGMAAFKFPFPAWMDGFSVVLPSIRGGVEISLWTSHETTESLRDNSEWLRWVRQLE